MGRYDTFGELVRGIHGSDPRAIGRAMRLLEDDPDATRELWPALNVHETGAYTLGVTGTAGAGKSTLVDRIVAAYRGKGERVGVVAVDPSSPHTGGALLGDRIRMQRHALDGGVFIHSVATRGAVGGLTRASGGMIRVLEAAGFDVIVVETVGAGQDELDVARLAHTVVVVSAPGLGDELQSMKAGILEIAHVLVLNKADREGSEAAIRDLERIGSRADAGEWSVPVLRTIATQNEGIDALVSTCEHRRAWLKTTQRYEEPVSRWREAEFRAEIRERWLARLEAFAHDDIERCAALVRRGAADPYVEAERIVSSVTPRKDDA